MASIRTVSIGFLAATLSACASHPPIATVAPLPAPAPLAAVPQLPAGLSPTMTIPAMLADGSYQTPNRDLTPAATLWHFRVALNVAALACRGTQGDEIVAAYNAMLKRRGTTLAAAEAHYAAQWRDGGGDWRDRYDDAMTRLYNYFSLSPARPAFCATAAQVLTEAATVPDDALPGFASTQLAALDRPFTDVYRAFDAWRNAGRPAATDGQPRTVIAIAAAPRTAPFASAAPTATPVVPAARTVASAVHPRLELDPSVFQ